MLRSIVVASLVLVGLLSSSEQNLPAQESLKEKVKPCIERGVEFLKGAQSKDGIWSFHGDSSPTNEKVVGVTALCGLALLESGVPTLNKHVQAAAKVIRAKAKDSTFNYTYSVCLSVLFLDRLNRGKPFTIRNETRALVTLIEKILAGQTADGRWGFKLEDKATADNSNTQFAVMALWTARKYAKVEVCRSIEKAMAKCEDSMRDSQDVQGGWAFQSLQNGKPIGSMTCAGILSIALHAGMEVALPTAMSGGNIHKTIDEDAQITLSRAFLLSMLQANCNEKGGDSHATYFLWSIQQVATLLKWRKLNGENWYDMGARFLMSKQSKRGSWALDWSLGENVDTALAVLFLVKSNLLGELQEAWIGAGLLGEAPLIKRKEKPAVAAKQALTRLLVALPGNQTEILLELQDGRGYEYTDALVAAIKQLPGAASKEEARKTLVKRFERLAPRTLVEYMAENDREMRLAAVIAIRVKSDTALAEKHVIPLLTDSDPQVSAAALETLRVLKK